MDSFSPLVAARVLVQVLPVGPITSSVFDRITASLTKIGALRLGDLKVPEDAGRNEFKAASLPNGKLSFHFSTATRLPSTALLYPFETFREPFVILGIADVARFGQTTISKEVQPDVGQAQLAASELEGYLGQLRENYPSALLHRILAVDEGSSLSVTTPDITSILSGEDLRPLMRDIGGCLIPELGGLARSFQALQTFSSPLARDGSQGSGDSTPMNLASGRRGSLQPTDSSLSSADLKASHRMSMPAHLINSGPNDIPGSRSGSPLHGGRASPAITFDDITGALPSQAAARKPTPTGNRESSADRGATSGFGSDTLNERNRTRQQGRLACVIGSLYLQAGLWSDALRELSDGIAKARSCSDHLWHAKGYENAIICLLLLSWNGINFRTPDVCYPSTSRPLAAKGPQTQSESPNPTQSPQPEEMIEAIKSFYELLPEMIVMARDLYLRTVKLHEESLPLSAYSELNVRLARLLTGLATNGQTDPAMQEMLETNLSFKRPAFRRGRVLARQASELLHIATPLLPDVGDISATETLRILGAIATSYSALGMSRKSALVLQDYLDCLTPSLVQARKLGAAEAGMHPAAGITNFQDISIGGNTKGSRIDDILVFFETIQLLPHKEHLSSDSAPDLLSNVELRLSLLRRCIRVCEALPDFDGILKCTSEFLRLAGPGSAPSLAALDVHIRTSPDEQALISSNFYRTSDLMDNLGLPKQGGCYWDKFLVRGIELQPAGQADELVSRRITDFVGAYAPAVQPNARHGPFLHDATAQRTNAQRSKPILVAGEVSTFLVILQNLYDFDVYIDTLELTTSHESFRPLRRDIRLSPRRIQMFSVSGKPHTPGHVKITGCRVTVKGCATSELGIFPDAWSPPEAVKIFPNDNNATDALATRPKASVFEALVLPPQPRLKLSGSSLSEKALEIHEGETKALEIQITNVSQDASMNFLKATSQDNISVYLLSALKERDLQPPLRYEIERQLYVEPVLQSSDADMQDFAPMETRNLRFEVLGKPGLTHLTILLDYAYRDDADSNSELLTRVLAIPITITTRPSLRIASFQLTALPEDPMGSLAPRESYCWMSLSFQNISARTLEATIRLANSTGTNQTQHMELVPPKSTTTMSYIIPKIYVENPHAVIPSLDPSKEQQFVVRTSGGMLIDDRAERERFWYVSKLLDSVKARWRDPSSHASGSISLRDIVLSTTELLTLRLDDLSIIWEGEPKGEVVSPSTARLKLVNRSNEPLRVELQLQQTLAGFVDRVAGGHIDTQLLSVIKPHSETIANFEVTFDCKGHHVLLPSVLEKVQVGSRLHRPLRVWHGEPSYVTVS